MDKTDAYLIAQHPEIPPALLEEYRMLDARWQAFDARLTAIKSGAVVVFGSLCVAFAANANSSMLQLAISIVAFVAMGLAWHQDWQNRCWQRLFFWRALSIEEFVRREGPLEPPVPLQIWTSWHRTSESSAMKSYRETQWAKLETAAPYFAFVFLAAFAAVWAFNDVVH